MTDKQTKLNELRAKIKALTPEQRQQLVKNCIVATIEGHQLSLYNTLMVYFQTPTTAKTPSIVGGYQQWRKAGNQVSKGEHGYTILFPIGQKNEEGETIEVNRFFTATVFDISQTEAIGTKSAEPAPVPTSEPVTPTPALFTQFEPQPAPQPKEDLMKGFVLV